VELPLRIGELIGEHGQLSAQLPPFRGGVRGAEERIRHGAEDVGQRAPVPHAARNRQRLVDQRPYAREVTRERELACEQRPQAGGPSSSSAWLNQRSASSGASSCSARSPAWAAYPIAFQESTETVASDQWYASADSRSPGSPPQRSSSASATRRCMRARRVAL